MEEKIVEQTEVQEAKVQEQEQPAQPAPEVDLVSRVAQVKVEPKKVTQEEGKFNINDLDQAIEKLPDPQIKSQVIELKKSLLRGENQKYQEIASLRKQYEQRLAEVTTWTPERIKQEMARPDFVQAANEILRNQSQSSDSEQSGLSEAERRRIEQAEQAARDAQAQLYQLQQSQIHTRLQSKYANYNPQEVQEDIVQLVNGKVDPQTILESAWKARDYEAAIRRAYDLGLQDKANLNKERIAGMTLEGGTNMPQPQTVERQKGETTQQFMARSYHEHLKKK